MLSAGPTARCAVLGRPIAHSLSPFLHRAAYDALGLEGWTYDAVEVGETELPGFLDGLDETWRGLSLTMPLKRTAVPLVGGLDPWASVSGAVNTVLLQRGRAVHGANTDVPGAAAALRQRTDADLSEAVVVGGGATATSILLALGSLGCRRAQLWVREPARAAETLAALARHPAAPTVEVRRLDETHAAPDTTDVVVSTVPAVAQDEALLHRLAAVPVVFEVLYDPWPTPLVRAAQHLDRVVVGGLDLLVHQAVLQVALMTGVPGGDTVTAAMRAAGEQELARRA